MINRKTTIPIKGLPPIVEWLLANASSDELSWMSSFSKDRTSFGNFVSILTKLTDYNIHDVFYGKSLVEGDDPMVFWASKRAEVAGLKAFEMACKIAGERIKEKKAAIGKKG